MWMEGASTKVIKTSNYYGDCVSKKSTLKIVDSIAEEHDSMMKEIQQKMMVNLKQSILIKDKQSSKGFFILTI